MSIHVLVEPNEGIGFRATSGPPLAIVAEGATQEEALGRFQSLLKARVAAGATIVHVPLPIAGDRSPRPGFLDLNDPLVQAWLADIEEDRKSLEDDPNFP